MPEFPPVSYRFYWMIQGRSLNPCPD